MNQIQNIWDSNHQNITQNLIYRKIILYKAELLKSNEIIKKYSALLASLPFTFLSSDQKKENLKLHFSAL